MKMYEVRSIFYITCYLLYGKIELNFNYKTKKMNWISTKDKLPEEGKYVIVRHNRGTWHDSTDQANVNCVVAKMRKGLSLKDREKLDPKSERARTYRSEDEHGNNLVPYYFDTFGPDSFFGQSITHWMPIEPLK